MIDPGMGNDAFRVQPTRLCIGNGRGIGNGLRYSTNVSKNSSIHRGSILCAAFLIRFRFFHYSFVRWFSHTHTCTRRCPPPPSSQIWSRYFHFTSRSVYSRDSVLNFNGELWLRVTVHQVSFHVCVSLIFRGNRSVLG